LLASRHEGRHGTQRVIKTALGGVSVRQAAARYGVGISNLFLWVRRARSGELSARRQDQPRGSKLDAHGAFLLELINASSHISLHEMQTRLREERGVLAGIGTLWRFLHARAITVKKPPTPASATGPTSGPRARLGLSGSLILTKMARLFRRGARAQRLRVGLPHGHWKTTTFVAGLRLSGFTVPMVLDRPTPDPWFATYFKQILVPTLR
jgi:transposase